MIKKQLTFKINGRDAVPVRAIPYVSSWIFFHPSVVVANLARHIRTLTIYRIPFNTPIQIKANEWRKLKKRIKELCLRYENNAISDVEWKREFVKLLPADAFVWRDDLENSWKNIRKNWNFIDKPLVNTELVLAPTLDADEIAMVMMDDMAYKNIGKYLDGYWEKPWGELPVEQRQAWREALSTIVGVDDKDGKEWGARDAKCITECYDRSNDPAFKSEKLVAWYDYCMNTNAWLDMDNVTPKEAAMLLCQMNPFEDEDPEHVFVDGDETSPDRYRLLLRAFEDKASVSPEPRTLMQWWSIALSRGLSYHSWIDEYVRATGVATPKDGTKKKRTNQNSAFFLECRRDGIEMNIESIWLHISKNAGKDGFPFTGASHDTATKVDGETVKKDKLGRALGYFLKP